MQKHQVILIAVGVILTIGLYQLPRVVVENDQLPDVMPHELDVTTADNEIIISLTEQLNTINNNKKSINFADSLASTYLKYQLVDSAVKYAQLILDLDSSLLATYTASMIYYRAFQNSVGSERSQELARTAEDLLNVLLENDPDNTSLKNKLAMTLMVSENPMEGVMMLRAILEKDPENREAIFNLGLLAIQSGQYERAEERFLKLTQNDATDHEALFYLGVVYAESDKKEKSIEAFKKYIEYDEADNALKATAENYIKDLENI